MFSRLAPEIVYCGNCGAVEWEHCAECGGCTDSHAGWCEESEPNIRYYEDNPIVGPFD